MDDSLRDEGVSAFRGRHREAGTALGRFLDAVRAGHVPPGSVLIVESLDRLSREQVLDALQQLIALVNASVEVVTLVDGRRYSREALYADSTSLIFSILVMTRAHEESATKSKRVADAWRRKRDAAVARQQAMTARCPGWIELVGGPREGEYRLIPARAEIVRSIFAATVAGDGRRTITKRLNDRREEPWGVGKAKGAHWHDSYVAKILSSHAVYGAYSKAGDVIEGYFPAVVTRDEFWRAQAAMAGRGHGQGKTSASFHNLLRGLATCEACGGAMTYVDKGKRSSGPAVVCSRSRLNAGCGEGTGIPYGGLELLVTLMYAHVADAQAFAVDEIERRHEGERAAVERRRDNLVSRRDNLMNEIEDGAGLAFARRRLQELSSMIDEAEAELARLERAAADQVELEMDIEERVSMIMDKLYAIDPVERYRGRADVNARLRKYLERIVVHHDQKLSYVFRPEYRGVTDAMRDLYNVAS